jgi:hypothetical protein
LGFEVRNRLFRWDSFWFLEEAAWCDSLLYIWVRVRESETNTIYFFNPVWTVNETGSKEGRNVSRWVWSGRKRIRGIENVFASHGPYL